MRDLDTILTINVVEPSLVRAVNLLGNKLGKNLKGLVLVHKDYAGLSERPRDDTGLFEEIICDFNNQNELQTVLKPYTDRLLAVTCRYEEAIQPFSQVIPFLPFLHTPSETALYWSTEKPLMRDRLCNYDPSLVPKYQNLRQQNLPELASLIEGFTYPLIVKPSGLAKALLVTRCDNEQELSDCLDRTFKIITSVYDREQYPGRPGVLIEEMMQGQMYSTDVYSTHDGEILCLPLVKVTTAHAVGLPGFYGYEQTMPVGLQPQEIEAAFEASRSAIKALNLSSTTAHVELFHTPNGWKIIEVAARIGGYRDTLYREAYGIEHFCNDLAIRMGVKPDMPGDAISNVAVLNIYADKEGLIDSIDGIDQAKKLDSVLELNPMAQPSDLALFSSNGGNPIVVCILKNDDAEQLRKDMSAVRDLITIKIKDKDETGLEYDIFYGSSDSTQELAHY